MNGTGGAGWFNSRAGIQVKASVTEKTVVDTNVGLASQRPAFKAEFGGWQNPANGNTTTVKGTQGLAGQSAGRGALDSGRHRPLDSQSRPARLYHGTLRPEKASPVSTSSTLQMAF